MTRPAPTPNGEELLRELAEAGRLEREQRLARMAFAPLPELPRQPCIGPWPAVCAFAALAALIIGAVLA